MVIQLAERDFQLLTLVGLCRYVSSVQVARAFFAGSRTNGDRRLRKLYHASLVDISMTGSQRPNIVSLSRQGLDLLKERSPELARRCSRLTSIPLTGIEHHLGIVDVRLAVAKRCQEDSGWSLSHWENGRGERYRQLGLSRYRLQPDALFDLTCVDQEKVCALEVDLGTEPLSILADKLDGRYDLALADGVIDELWLAVEGGAARVGNVKQLIERLGLAHKSKTVSLQELRGNGSGGSTRRRAGGEHGPTGPNATAHQPKQPQQYQPVRCANTDSATTAANTTATTGILTLDSWRRE
jgi:hypothetical protein